MGVKSLSIDICKAINNLLSFMSLMYILVSHLFLVLLHEKEGKISIAVIGGGYDK